MLAFFLENMKFYLNLIVICLFQFALKTANITFFQNFFAVNMTVNLNLMYLSRFYSSLINANVFFFQKFLTDFSK